MNKTQKFKFFLLKMKYKLYLSYFRLILLFSQIHYINALPIHSA